MNCQAQGCSAGIDPEEVMCGDHWRLVPYHLKREVLGYCPKGTPVDQVSSAGFTRVKEKAILIVALLEKELALAPENCEEGELKMAYLEFSLAHDPTQEAKVSVRQDHLLAICAMDQKKTRLMVGDQDIIIWGSYDEVMAKVRAAEV